jgi:hypothetical protein
MSRDIIVNVDIWHIIIVSMIVTYRAPVGLRPDIDTYA